MRMKIPLNADEYTEVKERAKFTLLDDYKKKDSNVARKVGPHELQAIEIFSKRSDAGNHGRIKINGVSDSKGGGSIKEGMDSGINFGPENPALLRSKTLGRKKNFRLNSNFSTTSLRKKQVGFTQDSEARHTEASKGRAVTEPVQDDASERDDLEI